MYWIRTNCNSSTYGNTDRNRTNTYSIIDRTYCDSYIYTNSDTYTIGNIAR
jgi:hypothetical protein